MARKVAYRDISQTLAAADKWIKSCLVENGSVFSPTELWTKELVEELHEAFIEHPDNGGDSFMTKLKRQMGTASPASQQLMAEMLWILLLFPSNINSSTKRQHTRDIWALSGHPLDESHPFLTDAIVTGIGSGGPAFNNLRPLELEYLIVLTRDLKLKNVDERRRIFSEYDQFIEWIDTVPRKGNRQFRHMLRFFAFPDLVERMSSNQDRRSILEAFQVAPRQDTKNWTDRQLDDALFKLRSDLQKDAPSEILDFYDSPWKERWKQEPLSLATDTQADEDKQVTTSDAADGDESIDDIRRITGPRFVWYFGPVLDSLRDLGGQATPREVIEWIRNNRSISNEEREAATKAGASQFDNRVGWARFYLAKAGLIDGKRRGVWALTDEGRETTLDFASAMDVFKSVRTQFVTPDDEEQPAPEPFATSVLFDDPNRKFWFVGANWNRTDDQTERFISDGIWQNGYDDELLDEVRSMQLGDRIAIKASFVRKYKLPFENAGRPVSCMRMKAIGTITGNSGDGKTIQVDWERLCFQSRQFLWAIQCGRRRSH